MINSVGSNELKILMPESCTEEQLYVYSVIFSDILGIQYQTEKHDEETIIITDKIGTKKIYVNADFFNTAHSQWLSCDSLPKSSKRISLNENVGISSMSPEDIPILFGKPFIKNISSNKIEIGFDLFGTIFFMLSRYEEAVETARDTHSRFDVSKLIAVKEGFLHRPIVNEYIELLWQCLILIFPKLKRKARIKSQYISCDVDHVFDSASYSLKRTIFRCAARIYRDKNLSLSFKDLINYFGKKFNIVSFDEYHNNIYWMGEITRSLGHKICFNFIPLETHELDNVTYQEAALDCMRYLHSIGHEIGVHPGYETYKSKELFELSIHHFKHQLSMAGVHAGKFGGRQHYLRYDVMETPRLWSDCELSYDSSLGFSDRCGFRSGICYEYIMYDLMERKPLKIKQRPLVAMDCALFDGASYDVASVKKAYNYINTLKEECKKYNGDFCLLWHNSYFAFPTAKSFFKSILV